MADENNSIKSKVSNEDQLALLKEWFPWLGEDEDQSGADTIDTLVEWHGYVGGIHRASDDEDHDIDDLYQVELDQNV
jgi:hypothetical protein